VVNEINAVLLGQSPAMIVSAGKSVKAYELLSQIADETSLESRHCQWYCEDGMLHEHLVVSLVPGIATEIVGLVGRSICREISRETLQASLGLMLGYDWKDVREFIASGVGASCKCDCCGGPATAK